MGKKVKDKHYKREWDSDQGKKGPWTLINTESYAAVGKTPKDVAESLIQKVPNGISKLSMSIAWYLDPDGNGNNYEGSITIIDGDE